MINIPFLLVRTDSEKHNDSTLTRRHLTAMMRDMEEQSFVGKAIPDRAGAQRRLRKQQERRSLLRSRDDSALAGVHSRGQGRTPSASGREQESHVNAEQGGGNKVVLVRPGSHTQHVKERV